MLRSQKSQIRKSSSVCQFRSLAQQQIVFNPSQFHVGQSKIQRLPQRVLSRRNSQPTLPRTQKYTSQKQCKQLQVSLLLKINEKLCKQNKELKQQLELYKKISKSNMTDSSRRTPIMEKINRTKCSSRLVSDSETGLYSSKQLSYNQFQTISELYDNYIKRSLQPTFSQVQEQLKKFFSQVQQTYIKLKYLFQSLSRSQLNTSPTQSSKCINLLNSINSICHLKIQHQKQEKYPGIKPSSRPKVERQPSKQKLSHEDTLELMSPDQVVDRFQKYVLKILASTKIIKGLKSNLVVRRFVKKLNEL